MNKLLILLMTFLSIPATGKINGQSFVTAIDMHNIGFLFGSPCIVKLNSGEVITGKFNGMSGVENAITRFYVIPEEGGKWMKFKAEEVSSLRIKTTKRAKNWAMLPGRTISINGWTINLDEPVIGDYIIFEAARLGKNSDKYRLLQLLNPGFDSKIKVLFFSIGEGGGFGTDAGADFSYANAGAMDYVFNKGEKSIRVKQLDYKKTFKELYSDCPKMLEVFNKEIKWGDAVKHIIVYDQLCK
jgi:hypothetical protein